MTRETGNVSEYGCRIFVSVVNSRGLSAVGEVFPSPNATAEIAVDVLPVLFQLLSGTVIKGGSVEIGLLEVPTMQMKREHLKGDKDAGFSFIVSKSGWSYS